MSAKMGTLASELGPHAERLTEQTRVYIDANVPARLVACDDLTPPGDVDVASPAGS